METSRYGWVIVAAMLAVQTVSSGFGFYNMSVYIAELSRNLSVSVADISLAISIFFVMGAIAGIWVARLLERFHVRWIMVVGAIGSGLALGLVGNAETVWQIYILFALFGVANTGVSLVVATTLVTRWFPGPNRSIALSISSTGLSLGGVVLTPVCAHLFNTVGLETTMPWIGVAFVVLTVPIALFCVRFPETGDFHGHVHEDAGWNYRDAVRSKFFVLLSIGYFFCQGAQVGGIAHIYNLVEGISTYQSAAVAVQALTICSISGRILGGWLLTRVPIRQFTLANALLQTLGLYLIATAETASAGIVGAAVFGLSVGNLLMLQPLWLAEAFPGHVYPRVFAMANAVAVAGVAIGPYSLGLLYDLADYTVAYYAAVLVSLLAFLFILTAGSRPREPQLVSGGQTK